MDAQLYQQLKELYTNPAIPGSFGGIDSLLRTAKDAGLEVTKSEVEEFLRTMPTYTEMHIQRVRFPRRRVISFDINWLWELDLAFMTKLASHNRGVNYLLVKVDVLSKQLAVEPLKKKTASETLAALKRMIERLGVQPKNISTDQGTEFTADEVKAWAKEAGINFYYMTNVETGAPNVERVIRTLKGRLYRYLNHMNSGRKRKTYNYLDILQDVVEAYNHSRHRSIGMAPADVREEHVDEIRARLFPHDHTPREYKFEVGAMVRVRMEREDFHRGFLPQFTKEVYVILRQLKTNPRSYTLTKLNGDAVGGTYYSEQMQLVLEKDHVVEQVKPEVEAEETNPSTSTA